MDTDIIKSLIDALEASTLTELEYSKDGTKLRLMKRSGASPVAVHPPSKASRVAPSAQPTELAHPQPVPRIVNAPMFGVVHLRRSPDAPPLMTAGQKVGAGDVLCLIEAMKVFTDLRCEQDGTIAEILVRGGQEVEAGQALFRLE